MWSTHLVGLDNVRPPSDRLRKKEYSILCPLAFNHPLNTGLIILPAGIQSSP